MPVPSYIGSSAAALVIMSSSTQASPVLFVEGNCEVRFFTHHFPSNAGQIISCGGYSGVNEAISAIEKWESVNNIKFEVLGFVDRDYGNSPQQNRTAMSNYRDVEIDMYMSKAGERLLNEKASKNKCNNAREVLDEAIKQLRFIGLVRKYNSDKLNSWNLNCINLEKCIIKNGEIDNSKFIYLLKQNNNLDESDLNSIHGLIDKCSDIMTEYLIRGHDLSTLLGKWLRKKIGNRKSAETCWSIIEENLRLATDYNELLCYEWAQHIKNHFETKVTHGDNSPVCS